MEDNNPTRTVVYPPLLQLLRVTAATVPGPNGVAQVAGSSWLAPPLHVAFTQQMRDDGTLLPRDREPCLTAGVRGTKLTAGFHLGRLSGSWTSLPVYEVVETDNIASINGETGPQLFFGPSYNKDAHRLTLGDPATHETIWAQLYEVGDLVTSGGNVYRCILQPTGGQAPGNGTYWENLGASSAISLKFKQSIVHLSSVATMRGRPIPDAGNGATGGAISVFYDGYQPEQSSPGVQQKVWLIDLSGHWYGVFTDNLASNCGLRSVIKGGTLLTTFEDKFIGEFVGYSGVAFYDTSLNYVGASLPYFMAIGSAGSTNPTDSYYTDDSTGGLWLAVQSITPVVWDTNAGYVRGQLVTHAGDTFILIAGSVTSIDPAPVDGATWKLVVPNNRGNWSSSNTYALGDYVQDNRPVYAITPPSHFNLVAAGNVMSGKTLNVTSMGGSITIQSSHLTTNRGYLNLDLSLSATVGDGGTY